MTIRAEPARMRFQASDRRPSPSAEWRTTASPPNRSSSVSSEHGRQGDLRHEPDRAPTRLERLRDRPQVDLGLPASRHAEEERRKIRAVSNRFPDPAERAPLGVRQRDRLRDPKRLGGGVPFLLRRRDRAGRREALPDLRPEPRPPKLFGRRGPAEPGEKEKRGDRLFRSAGRRLGQRDVPRVGGVNDLRAALALFGRAPRANPAPGLELAQHRAGFRTAPPGARRRRPSPSPGAP